MSKTTKEEALRRAVQLTNAKQVGANEWRSCCPVHGGTKKNTFVIRDSGDSLLYYCHAGCTQDEVIAWMIEHECWPSNGAQEQYSIKKQGPYKTWDKEFKLTAAYRYLGGYVARYENEKQEKQVIPFFKGGGTKPGFPEVFERPLYDPRSAIHDAKKLYIVEGEKCADFLAARDIDAITWIGGSSQVKKTDWSSLAGKEIFIWPDNDEVGKKAAYELKEILKLLDCSISICDPPESLPEGGDCADLDPETSKEALLQIFHSKNEGATPLTVFSCTDYIQLHIEQPHCYCGWIFESSISMIHAWRGTGKSWYSLSLAYAIATGGGFLRYEASEDPRKVLYLDGEMGAYSLQRRLRTITDINGGECADNLDIVTPKFNKGVLPRLSTPEGREIYTELIKAQESEVIFIDNISRLVGGDDNDPEIWEPVEDWAIKQKHDGKSIIFIHHSGKSGAQRGTSRREDAIEYTVGLRAPEFTEEEGIPTYACFEIHYEKTRDEFDNTPFTAWLSTKPEPEEGNIAESQEWRHCSIQDYKKQRALNLYAKEFSFREIGKMIKVDKERVEEWIAGFEAGEDE